MTFLRNFLDKKVEPHFQKGGRLERLYPLYEMVDTILYTPGSVTRSAPHIRDGIDQKRLMITVVFALLPCMAMAWYNTGYQAFSAMQAMSITDPSEAIGGWRGFLLQWLNLPIPNNPFGYALYGLIGFLPIYAVVMAVGGFWEVLFAVIRKHEVTEAFLVTGTLIALVLPPQIPLWQVALGTSFGVVVGKEIFGGVGFNILNPALTARAFLFFAYPAEISGNAVWVAVDGYTKATPLALAAEGGMQSVFDGGTTWWNAFVGLIPGSAGETSTLLCLVGAGVLLWTGIGSWRIMFSVLIGMVATSLLFNLLSTQVSNPMFELPFWWHMVLGGFAFGMVFMATDPVSASMTQKGQWIYGFLIGVMSMLIRVANPAFPEGMMLAILFMNIFASTIDYYVVDANIKKRLLRYSKPTKSKDPTP